MIYAGVDWSISCPCICVYDDTLSLNHEHCDYYFFQANTSLKKQKQLKKVKNIFAYFQPKYKDNYTRYNNIAEYFENIITINKVETVVFENYALRGVGRIADIVECTCIFKEKLYLLGLNVYAFPPCMIKRTFSGKGNAKKDTMINSYKKLYGIDIPQLFERSNDYGSPFSDIVDSHAALYTLLNTKEREEYKLFGD